jgi:hypothetical protein
MQPLPPERRLRNAVKHGWTRLVGAARRRRRLALRQRPPRRAPVLAAIDPVALTVLAVNRLGPATLRTVLTGKPLTVRVPNARVGEIFRAALAEMQKTRLTDRLIAIAIDDDPDAGRVPTRA